MSKGNFTLGLKEALVFDETCYNQVIVGRTDMVELGQALIVLFGFFESFFLPVLVFLLIFGWLSKREVGFKT